MQFLTTQTTMLPGYALPHVDEISAQLAGDAAEASMVGRMRLVLSASAIMTAFIDPAGIGGVNGFIWLVFCGYAFHSIVLYILSQFDQPFMHGRLIHWLDVLWYALIVFFTGGSNSPLFLFFFFAILTSSFRWGFDEGARITLASAALFATTAIMVQTSSEFSRLLLRCTFLLALGYMIAYWGGLEVTQKCRLALLRRVSQMSNPRFGVDQTIASVMEKTRIFFKASSCILVMQDTESASWSLRTAMQEHAGRSIHAETISADAAAPLMAFPREQIVVHTCPIRPALSKTGGTRTLDHAQARWIKQPSEPGASVAELLEARAFISAPLTLRKGSGRIYVVSSKHGFSKADALFLGHIVEQAFPVIENIELLDRLASDAASRERQKIARDLHDSAIQPYIGLKHGLSAVRDKAGVDNPLIDDLDKLAAMTTQVIGDLRHFAGTFNSGLTQSEPVLLSALRRQTAQVMEFYGIDITLSIEGSLDISDRLSSEVFQIVNEGLSNIRKHTSARHGMIKLKRTNGQLDINIENEGIGRRGFEFVPRSISERSTALGGKAEVVPGPNGGTAVHIEIPV